MTTTAQTQSLTELRTKLRNLVANVDDRLARDDTNRGFLLETLLDRIFELVTIGGMSGLCGHCGRYPATSYVYAGIPGTQHFRSQAVCVHCTLLTITWAATFGPVHVTTYPTDAALAACPVEVAA
jgi:hypothetical protein